MVADIYALRAAEKGIAFTLDNGLQAPTWVSGDSCSDEAGSA